MPEFDISVSSYVLVIALCCGVLADPGIRPSNLGRTFFDVPKIRDIPPDDFGNKAAKAVTGPLIVDHKVDAWLAHSEFIGHPNLGVTGFFQFILDLCRGSFLHCPSVTPFLGSQIFSVVFNQLVDLELFQMQSSAPYRSNIYNNNKMLCRLGYGYRRKKKFREELSEVFIGIKTGHCDRAINQGNTKGRDGGMKERKTGTNDLKDDSSI